VKLRTQHFDTGTIGFAAPEDSTTAVCVLPGTELAWCSQRGLFGWKVVVLNHTTAIFRQINKHNPRTTFSHSLLAAVAHQPEVELESAIDRLIAAGLLSSL
jgi:hypothetical protein